MREGARWTARHLLAALLVLSWLAMLYLMWARFWTMPETLRTGSMVRPPTLQGLGLQVAASAAELGAALLLLWPRWRRHYGARLAAAGVGLLAWFLYSTPLSLTSVEQVHRRWLAGVALLLLLLALGRGVRAALGGRGGRWGGAALLLAAGAGALP